MKPLRTALRTAALAAALAASAARAQAPGSPGSDAPPSMTDPHGSGQTSIGVLGGARWLYDPGLADVAREMGDPLTSSAPLGYGVRLPFAYWNSPYFQYALELGYAQNTHIFRSGKKLSAWTMTAELVGRILPWPRLKVWPYVGGGIGYFLTHSSTSLGTETDSAAGFSALLGAGYGVNDSFTLMLELRGTVASEAVAPEKLGVQPGGVFLLVGFAYAWEPWHDPAHPSDPTPAF